MTKHEPYDRLEQKRLNQAEIDQAIADIKKRGGDFELDPGKTDIKRDEPEHQYDRTRARYDV